MTKMLLLSFVVPFLLLWSRYAEAHTWIDCFDTDRSKLYDQSASYIFGGAGGNGFCEGYGAGYPGRGDIDIGTVYTYKMLKNEVEAGTTVCQSADANTYSDWRKRLSVAPGQTAYFAYLPNGHIVKDKKAIGTQHGVYWTGVAGTSLTTTLDMTPEHLLDGHTTDYDDGNCGETVDSYGNPGGRAGDGKPCIGSFVFPAGTAPGIYNMVWYWTFWLDNEAAYIDQAQAKGYFGAAYSTCFEVEVTSSDSVTNTAAPTTAAVTAATAKPANDTVRYKSGATATFSGLKSGDGSLAGVHAQDSSSGSQDYAEVTFENTTVDSSESSSSITSSKRESVDTLTSDDSVPAGAGKVTIVVTLLFATIVTLLALEL
ncbi:hypothetical protein PRIC1_000307 [Phytophthora ramorum]